MKNKTIKNEKHPRYYTLNDLSAATFFSSSSCFTLSFSSCRRICMREIRRNFISFCCSDIAYSDFKCANSGLLDLRTRDCGTFNAFAGFKPNALLWSAVRSFSSTNSNFPSFSMRTLFSFSIF